MTILRQAQIDKWEWNETFNAVAPFHPSREQYYTQKAIDLGLEQMPKSNAVEKSELSKIIGESYFNLQQYDSALPYLVEYKGRISE